ncbi:MAG: anti-sigma factor [Candidatus Omnitrophota bacterium]
MNCKKIQDMIIADYLDGTADEKEKQNIQAHLSNCKHCQEFLKIAKKTVIEPFQNAQKEKAPEEAWANIKTMILKEKQESQSNPVFDFLNNLKTIFNPQPAFAIASILSVCLIAIIVSRNIPNKNENDYVKVGNGDYEEYVVSTMEYSDDASGEDEYSGYGTAIEEMFLQS